MSDLISETIFFKYVSYVSFVVSRILIAVTKSLSWLLGYLPTIVSVGGAIAAWAPIVLKKPQLTVHVLVKREPIMTSSVGGMPGREEKAWSLAVKIKNCGEWAAKNIELKAVCVFNGKEQPHVRKISGDLLLNEEIFIFFDLKQDDAENEKNHIQISLCYNGSGLKSKRKYQRKSIWYFNVRNGHLISDDLHRVQPVAQG